MNCIDLISNYNNNNKQENKEKNIIKSSELTSSWSVEKTSWAFILYHNNIWFLEILSTLNATHIVD